MKAQRNSVICPRSCNYTHGLRLQNWYSFLKSSLPYNFKITNLQKSYKYNTKNCPFPSNHWKVSCELTQCAIAAAKSCPTQCDPTDGSPPGSCPWDSPGKNTGVGCHFLLQYIKVKSESEVAQSCPTVCNPMDCSLPGSSIHGISQARVLEWTAIAFSITFKYFSLCI